LNGKPGDDPATDIILHGRTLFSPDIDAEIRELGKLMDFRQLQEFTDSLRHLPIAEIGRAVSEHVARLRSEATTRGWEMK